MGEAFAGLQHRDNLRDQGVLGDRRFMTIPLRPCGGNSGSRRSAFRGLTCSSAVTAALQLPQVNRPTNANSCRFGRDRSGRPKGPPGADGTLHRSSVGDYPVGSSVAKPDQPGVEGSPSIEKKAERASGPPGRRFGLCAYAGALLGCDLPAPARRIAPPSVSRRASYELKALRILEDLLTGSIGWQPSRGV